MATSAPLVMGLDIGGTSTRALVIDTQGRRVGSGRGPGANLTSHAIDRALAAIAAAVRQALNGLEDPGAVQRAVIGTAGDANFRRPEVADAFQQLWGDVGLSCSHEIVADAQVAYVAGTAEPDGTLILCGTGALTARFENRRRAQTIDGHGWLLGDFGSGFWLGREAVRATLAAFDRLERPGPLGQAVLRALVPADGARPDPWDDPAVPPGADEIRAFASLLALAVHARPPVMLAELAPLVSAEADNDPEARRIFDEAAGHLLHATSLVRPEGDATPIVFAGSLLTSPTPLRSALQPRLAEAWPKATTAEATDGAAGAAWLAAADLLGPDSDESADLHARLLGR